MGDDSPDRMPGWLERSIQALEKASTDEQVRVALQACLSDLSHSGGPEWFKAFVGANLGRAVATVTYKQLHDNWLPAMRQERDRLAARAAGGSPPPPPPSLPGPAAPPGEPRNVANRPGCFGGTGILLLGALLRLPQ